MPYLTKYILAADNRISVLVGVLMRLAHSNADVEDGGWEYEEEDEEEDEDEDEEQTDDDKNDEEGARRLSITLLHALSNADILFDFILIISFVRTHRNFNKIRILLFPESLSAWDFEFEFKLLPLPPLLLVLPLLLQVFE